MASLDALPDSTTRSRNAPVTVRIASWSARHRWPVFGLWFLATIGLFVAGAAAGGTRAASATGGNGSLGTESAKANAVFEAAGRGSAGEDVEIVVTNPGGAVTAAPFKAAMTDLVASLKATAVSGKPVFSEVLDPLTAPAQAGLVAPDGTAVRLVAHFEDPTEAGAAQITKTLATIKARYPAYLIHAVSQTLTSDEIATLVNGDLDSSLRLSLPATFAILLIAFGAVAAAFVPLVLAITALLAAMGLLALYSHVFNPVSPYASQLVVLMGLAVAVDYSLFLITRFRRERRRGLPKQAAIEAASGTAGRAVFFSGLAVLISVASLYLLPDELFHSMALATIAVVLVSVVGSLTFLPATLAIMDGRLNWGRIPYFGRERPDESGFWSRLIRGVMRQPAIAAAGATVLLVALASPVLAMRFGSTDLTAFPSSLDGVQAVEQLNAHWPAGTTLTLDVIVTRADVPATQSAIKSLEAAALKIQGLSEPVTVTPSGDGSVARVAFVMRGGQNDPANQAIVRQVRSTVVPAVFGGLPGVHAYVDGNAALALDSTDVYTGSMPLVFGFVLGLSFLLLLVAFRSLVIPIKAIVLNLLSTGASYGVLVLVFEKGWFKDQLGVIPTEVIEAWVPIFVFAILFGLSMDYHVFILTRIKELVDRGMSSNEAVAHGIAGTSGTVTSAAAIMVVVFAVFATLRLVVVRELGLGLAVAVFVDATVIRSVLLPATMRLLGDWNWYLPRWLGWLPHVRIEAEPAGEPAPGIEPGRRAEGGLVADAEA